MAGKRWVGVVLGGAAAAAAAAALVREQRRRSQELPTGLSTSRLSRTARLAKMSGRSASTYAAAKVRAAVAPPEQRAHIEEQAHLKSAEQVVETLGAMKGAVMKLAQLVSFAADGLPEQYRDVLKSLQTQAPAMDYCLVEDVVATELGRPPQELFRSFEREPAAAASIGQVHRAELEGHVPVAVKVQYPGVSEAIRADLSNAGFLYGISGLLMPGLEAEPIIDELKARLGEELDYRIEATNQSAFRAAYEDHPLFHVPAVYPAFSSERVITMEWVDGAPFDAVCELPREERDDIGERIFRFVFGSLYRHHMFNGDPHPGNYLFQADGRVTFLDFGCVKRFSEAAAEDIKKMVHAVVDGDADGLREVAVAQGYMRADAPISAADLYDHLRAFYAPVCEDREFTYTHEYAADCLTRLFDPAAPTAHVQRHLTMPGELVLLQRINLGLNSVLASLGATANWHRISREYWFGDPPSTPLGRMAAAWQAERAMLRRRRELRGQ